MFSFQNSKEDADKSRKVKKTAKIAELSNFEARPLRFAGDQLPCAVNHNQLIVLGVSLSQPYSHGEYVGQMLEALKEKIDRNNEKMLGNTSWHVIVLLSTAYDPANDSRFDIQDTGSSSSLEAKRCSENRAAQWIDEHTPTLNSYHPFFSHTIMSGDPCFEGEEYQRVLSAFEAAYAQGKACSDASRQATCSLASVDPQKKLNDRSFYNCMKKIVDAYVERNSSKVMTKTEKQSLADRSQWVVLREYSLIFMLSLGKVPPSFAADLSLAEMDYAYFAYPFGNFGKEVINLFRNLFINDSLGKYNMGLYNIRLDDFCSKKNQNQKQEVASSPLTKENLSKLQDIFAFQQELFSRINECSEAEKECYFSYLHAVVLQNQAVPQFSTELERPVAKPRTDSDLTDKDMPPSDATVSVAVSSWPSLYSEGPSSERSTSDNNSASFQGFVV